MDEECGSPVQGKESVEYWREVLVDLLDRWFAVSKRRRSMGVAMENWAEIGTANIVESETLEECCRELGAVVRDME